MSIANLELARGVAALRVDVIDCHGGTEMTLRQPDRSDVKESWNVTRRGFCNGMLLTSAALVVAANAESARAAGVTGYPAVKIEGAVAMAPRSFLLFSYPSRNDPAILVRTSDGKFFAHAQKCSHLGCSVNFNAQRDCLECPCHLGAYDLKNGSVLHGPPRRPLDRIFLEIRGGEVWAVGRTNDYDAFINTAAT
ncbi:MAG TPA: Rieske 2Fe-2S domain-containing protein [Pyrinomonadaceae bacterium]